MGLNTLVRVPVALALALAFSSSANAEFTGKVVAIADGDTITVLRGREQVKVRLLDIDAPEKGQAFGNRSKQSLSDLCFSTTAKLDRSGKDRYGRTLATIYCNGVNANAEQVRRSMAWVYEGYAPMKSLLYRVQAEAKAARRGLWADKVPVPPWEWRKAGK